MEAVYVMRKEYKREPTYVTEDGSESYGRKDDNLSKAWKFVRV